MAPGFENVSLLIFCRTIVCSNITINIMSLILIIFILVIIIVSLLSSSLSPCTCFGDILPRTRLEYYQQLTRGNLKRSLQTDWKPIMLCRSEMLRTANADMLARQHEAPLTIEEETRARADSGLVALEWTNKTNLQCHNGQPHSVNNVMPTSLQQHIITETARHIVTIHENCRKGTSCSSTRLPWTKEGRD